MAHLKLAFFLYFHVQLFLPWLPFFLSLFFPFPVTFPLILFLSISSPSFTASLPHFFIHFLPTPSTTTHASLSPPPSPLWSLSLTCISLSLPSILLNHTPSIYVLLLVGGTHTGELPSLKLHAGFVLFAVRIESNGYLDFWVL